MDAAFVVTNGKVLMTGGTAERATVVPTVPVVGRIRCKRYARASQCRWRGKPMGVRFWGTSSGVVVVTGGHEVHRFASGSVPRDCLSPWIKRPPKHVALRRVDSRPQRRCNRNMWSRPTCHRARSDVSRRLHIDDGTIPGSGRDGLIPGTVERGRYGSSANELSGWNARMIGGPHMMLSLTPVRDSVSILGSLSVTPVPAGIKRSPRFSAETPSETYAPGHISTLPSSAVGPRNRMV